MAQLALAAAGGAIGGQLITGTFLGLTGQAIGWTAGSLLGGALFTDIPDQHGPRLDSTKVTSSAYGVPINIVYGTMRVPGNIIWAADLKETRHEEDIGGKGGPSATSTTYYYAADFAVSLGEGELNVLKIYANNILIYDKEDPASPSILALEANNEWGQYITVYTGSETQTADPLIESYEGAGNVPGFRGECYVVFENLPLAKFGNAIPNITAVVSDATTESWATGTHKTHDFTTNYYSACSYVDSEVQVFTPYHYLSNRNYRLGSIYPDGNVVETSTDFDLEIATSNLRIPCQADRPVHIARENTGGLSFRVGEIDGSYNEYTTGGLVISGSSLSMGVKGTEVVGRETTNNTSLYWTGAGSPIASVDEVYISFFITDDYIYCVNGATTSTLYRYTKPFQNRETLGSFSTPGGSGDLVKIFVESDDVQYLWWTYHLYKVEDGTITQIKANASGTAWAGRENNGSCSFTMNGSGELAIFAGNEPEIDETGLVTYAYKVLAADNSTTLANVVTDLCARVGLTASDIDVSTLTDTVKGFVINNQSSPRAALEALQNAYHFDAYESEYKLKFKKRS